MLRIGVDFQTVQKLAKSVGAIIGAGLWIILLLVVFPAWINDANDHSFLPAAMDTWVVRFGVLVGFLVLIGAIISLASSFWRAKADH